MKSNLVYDFLDGKLLARQRLTFLEPFLLILPVVAILYRDFSLRLAARRMSGGIGSLTRVGASVGFQAACCLLACIKTAEQTTSTCSQGIQFRS
jgi:hypothetical protein